MVAYQTRSRGTQWMGWLGGIALGALLMYIADPSEGRRRRARLQDQLTHYYRQTQRTLGSKMRDVRNRLSGLRAETMRRISAPQAKPMDDHVLEARVRSRMTRAFPQTEYIEVKAERGMVTLGGQVDETIKNQLIELVAGIPGVQGLTNDVRSNTHPEESCASTVFEQGSPLWIAGAIGTGWLTWYGLTRRQPLGLMAAAAAMSLLGQSGRQRATTGEILQEKQAETWQGYEVERSIDIHASPELVYDVCSRYENFPHFMSHVIEVRDLGHHRAHWVVQGLGGGEIEFDTRRIDTDQMHRLAWRSEPDAIVESEGMIALQPQASGTRATIRMSWRPQAKESGKGVVVLAGADPEAELDGDLQRLKQFIERGLPPRESAGGAAILH